MRWLNRIAAAAASAAVTAALVVAPSGAGAGGDPGAGGAPPGATGGLFADAAGPGGCAAQDYLDGDDVLRPGRALCNGNYLLRMQPNGDLVLREISTGRACWHSDTFVAGVSTTFEPGHQGNPVDVGRPRLRVGRHVIEGDNHLGDLGTTANLNANGEFWVGYRQLAAC